MVFFSLALCVSQMDAVGQKRRMAALKGSAPWWDSSLDRQERARGGLVAHFTHTVIPPRGKSPFCLKGAGKRSCVRMERRVVSAPSRQRSWVKPQKSFHFLWKKKKKKQHYFYFLSAVLDFKIHYILNAYTVWLFFSNKRTRFFPLYAHKQRFSCNCDRGWHFEVHCVCEACRWPKSYVPCLLRKLKSTESTELGCNPPQEKA